MTISHTTKIKRWWFLLGNLYTVELDAVLRSVKRECHQSSLGIKAFFPTWQSKCSAKVKNLAIVTVNMRANISPILLSLSANIVVHSHNLARGGFKEWSNFLCAPSHHSHNPWGKFSLCPRQNDRSDPAAAPKHANAFKQSVVLLHVQGWL